MTRHSSHKKTIKLEPAGRIDHSIERLLVRASMTIHEHCQLDEIADALCHQFEQRTRQTLPSLKLNHQKKLEYIEKDFSDFMVEHQEFFNSRNPNDVLSILKTPQRSNDKGAENAFEPTLHIPGSEEKIRILIERQSAGLPLWHPHDATYAPETSAAISLPNLCYDTD